jgi:hypothetical protein
MSGIYDTNGVSPHSGVSYTQRSAYDINGASPYSNYLQQSVPVATGFVEKAQDWQLPPKKRRITYLPDVPQVQTQPPSASFNFASIGSNFPSPTTTSVPAGNTLSLGADPPLPLNLPQPVLFNADPYTSYGPGLNDQTPFLPSSQVLTAGWQPFGGFSSPPPAYTLPLSLPVAATGTPPTSSAEYSGGTPNLTLDAPILGPPHANPQTPREFYENSLYAIEPIRMSAGIKGMTVRKLDDPNSAYAYLMATPNVYRSAGEIATEMGREPDTRYKLSQTMNSTINATLLPFGFDAVRLAENRNCWKYAFLLNPNMKAEGQRGKVYKPPVGHQRNCNRPPTK